MGDYERMFGAVIMVMLGIGIGIGLFLGIGVPFLWHLFKAHVSIH